MKQITLILSLVIAAFVAACSDGATSTALQSNGGGQGKTLEQLEKASTDQSLEALKAQLEVNPNLQVPDIIQAVKSRFGTNKRPVKDQPSDIDDKNRITRQEKVRRQNSTAATASATSEENAQVTAMLLALQEADITSDATKIQVLTTGNVEKKTICIKTCKTQILVERQYDNTKALSAVRAFVIVVLDKENIQFVDSLKGEKTVTSLTAYYAAANQNMILKIKVAVKDGKELNLTTKPFSYAQKDFSGEFSGGLQKGEFAVEVEDGKKFLNLTFAIQDIVQSHLVDDYGLFGRNTVAETTEAPVTSDESKTEEQNSEAKKDQSEDKVQEAVPAKLSEDSGVRTQTNPKGKRKVVPKPRRF